MTPGGGETLEYERRPPENRRLSKMAVVALVWGCVQLFPIQILLLGDRFGGLALKAAAFLPPIACCVWALLVIIHLRHHSLLRGTGFAVAGFWCGVGSFFTAGAMMLFLEILKGLG